VGAIVRRRPRPHVPCFAWWPHERTFVSCAGNSRLCAAQAGEYRGPVTGILTDNSDQRQILSVSYDGFAGTWDLRDNTLH
jgi:hypothetical protein